MLAEAIIKAQKERDKLTNININEVNSTFKECFLKYCEHKKNILRPNSIKSLEACYKNYFSKLDNKKLYKITRKDILKALEPLIQSNKATMFETAIIFLNGFFEYSIQFDRINSNPVKLIKPSVLFPAKKAVKHNPHLNDIESVIKLKLQILELKTYPSTKQALITILYTATRPDETLGARWCEFDFEKGVWNIPAERMKAKKAFTIPLNTQILNFLKELHKYAKHENDIIFKNTKGGKISKANLLNALKYIGYANTLTTHGLRGTFASIANDLRAEHGLSNDIIQASLAHETQNQVAQAYNHSIYLEERTRLLQWWGNKLGNII